MNCFYHPADRYAVAQCGRCGKGLCADCAYGEGDVRCFDDLLVAVQTDSKIAMGRIIRVWAFTGLITLGWIMIAWAALNGDGPASDANGPLLLLMSPVIGAGAWFFYMGMSWIYEKVRHRGPNIGVGVVTSGRGAGSSLIGGGRMSADPYGSIFGIFIVVAIISIAFLIVVWPIMIIGLATGIQKYKLDRRISRVVGDSSWVEWFPGKYRPDTKQYIPVPSAPEPEPEVA